MKGRSEIEARPGAFVGLAGGAAEGVVAAGGKAQARRPPDGDGLDGGGGTAAIANRPALAAPATMPRSGLSAVRTAAMSALRHSRSR